MIPLARDFPICVRACACPGYTSERQRRHERSLNWCRFMEARWRRSGGYLKIVLRIVHYLLCILGRFECRGPEVVTKSHAVVVFGLGSRRAMYTMKS